MYVCAVKIHHGAPVDLRHSPHAEQIPKQTNTRTTYILSRTNPDIASFSKQRVILHPTTNALLSVVSSTSLSIHYEATVACCWGEDEQESLLPLSNFVEMV